VLLRNHILKSKAFRQSIQQIRVEKNIQRSNAQAFCELKPFLISSFKFIFAEIKISFLNFYGIENLVFLYIKLQMKSKNQ